MYVYLCVSMHTMFSMCDPSSQQGQRSEAVSHDLFPRIFYTRNEFWFGIGHQSFCGLIEIRMTYCTLSIYLFGCLSVCLSVCLFVFLSIDLSNLSPILSYFISVYCVPSWFILSHFILSYLSLSYIYCICTLFVLVYLILVFFVWS